MADFETIRLGTVFAAEVAPYFKRRQRMSLRDVFEVAVPSVRRAEVVPVATIRCDAMDLVIECVGVDGRLFRPFLDAHRGPWTLETLRRKWPTVALDRPTPLSSPWREAGPAGEVDWVAKKDYPPPDRERARGDLEAMAVAGLRFVDGVLHRETRPPSWLFGVEDDIDHRSTQTGFADWGRREMLAVIDARVPREEVASLAREFGVPIPAREGHIEVHEPSLIPETAEADSLLKFVGWLRSRIGRLGAEGAIGQILQALDAEAVASVAGRMRRDGAYRLIGELGSLSSSRRVPQIGPEGIIAAVNGARTFLRLGRKLRDLAPEPVLVDEDDADALRVAFGP